MKEVQSHINSIIKDRERMLEITKSYIDEKLPEIKTLDDSVSALKDLDGFLKSVGYKPYMEFVLELLNNTKFSTMCKLIYEKYKENIINGRIEDIFENRFIVLVLETYYANEYAENDLEQENIQDFSSDVVLSADKQYRLEIFRIPLLTREEERKLAEDYQKGDFKARQKLIYSNLRWVYKIASSNAGRGEELGDLIQEGNLGLITAVDKFDPSKGFKLSTYATYYIRRNILDAIATNKLIRRAASAANKIKQIETISSQILNEKHREPTTKEIAKALHTSPAAVQKLMNISQIPFSLHSPVGTDETEFMYYLKDEESVGKIEEHLLSQERKTKVREILEKCNLKYHELYAIVYYFGLSGEPDLTYEEIGLRLAKENQKEKPYARQYIGDIIKRAILKILNSEHIYELAELLDNPEKGRKLISAYREQQEPSKRKQARVLQKLLNNS